MSEFCEVTGHERKYASKLLSGRRGPKTVGAKRRGRPPSYGEPERKALQAIWKQSEMPCGKRLVAMLADWLGPYERVHGTLESESRKRLLKMSAATADRLLQAHKVQGGASMSESFVWALSATDVFSGWPEV